MAISFFDKFCDQPIKVLHYKKPKPMAVANKLVWWYDDRFSGVSHQKSVFYSLEKT